MVVRVTVVQVLQSWPVIVTVEVVSDVQDDCVVLLAQESRGDQGVDVAAHSCDSSRLSWGGRANNARVAWVARCRRGADWPCHCRGAACDGFGDYLKLARVATAYGCWTYQ